MGTNFYTLGGKHVGKRFANGVWCWDCRIGAKRDRLGDFWFCPNCGKRASATTLVYNPAFREFRFDKNDPKMHHGVDGASGWIWCIGEYGIADTVEGVKKRLPRYRFIEDEYGRKHSMKGFLKIFRDVIIEDSSDADFS